MSIHWIWSIPNSITSKCGPVARDGVLREEKKCCEKMLTSSVGQPTAKDKYALLFAPQPPVLSVQTLKIGGLECKCEVCSRLHHWDFRAFRQCYQWILKNPHFPHFCGKNDHLHHNWHERTCAALSDSAVSVCMITEAISPPLASEDQWCACFGQ